MYDKLSPAPTPFFVELAEKISSEVRGMSNEHQVEFFLTLKSLILKDRLNNIDQNEMQMKEMEAVNMGIRQGNAAIDNSPSLTEMPQAKY